MKTKLSDLKTDKKIAAKAKLMAKGKVEYKGLSNVVNLAAWASQGGLPASLKTRAENIKAKLAQIDALMDESKKLSEGYKNNSKKHREESNKRVSRLTR